MITSRTVIQKDRVIYTVERADEVVWNKSVFFGRKTACRAGGYRFQSASREQETVAARSAGDGERVEEVIINERA